MTSEARRRRRPERICVVGSGKAAGALSASLKRARIVHTACGSRTPTIDVGDATIVVVAVADAAIGDVARRLSTGTAIVVHLAGSLGKGALPASLLPRRGVFHPLASLESTIPIPAGSLCAVDADTDVDCERLRGLAVRLRLAPARVTDDGRARYHAGAVIAGNLATALIQLGVEQLMSTGIDEAQARVSLSRLLLSTAARAEASPLSEALTGPVARGDVDTVRRHLVAMTDAPTRAIYQALTRVLVQRVRPPRAAGLDWSVLGAVDNDDSGG